MTLPTIILQARMESTRFPGKVLYELKNKPTLLHLIDALKQADYSSNIIVATSLNSADDNICELCKTHSIEVFRGEQHNVASRFYEILKNSHSEEFIRISGDSPLFDYRIVKEALLKKSQTGANIVSSALKRTLPKGMNIEVLDKQVYLNNYSNFSSNEDFEHVTQYFYRNAGQFDIHSISPLVENPENYNFCFDTEEDKNRLELIFQKLEKEHYEYTLAQKCKIYDELFSDNGN